MDAEEIRLSMCTILIAISFYFVFQLNMMQRKYLDYLEHIEKESQLQRPKRRPPQPRTLFYYETVVLRISSTTFRSHFRLTRKSFENLCQLLGPKICPISEPLVMGRPRTDIEKQLLPVLWLLATPDSYRSVADRFNMSKGTLFLFFERVIEELYRVSHRYIKWPSPTEMLHIKKHFYKLAKMDDCIIGAIDGSYVVIPAPKQDPHVYKTRKNNYAMTLQAICLPSLYFTDCYVGYPGSVSDRRIFENSTFYQSVSRSEYEFFPNNEYIIGNKAYLVLNWCQAPYIRHHVLTEAQELYNRILSGTRQVIERAFALLFGRFRRLKFLDMHRQDLLNTAIIACCVLHNICIEELEFEDFIMEGMEHVNENQPDEQQKLFPRNVSNSGDSRRNEITRKLFDQHQVRTRINQN